MKMSTFYRKYENLNISQKNELHFPLVRLQHRQVEILEMRTFQCKPRNVSVSLKTLKPEQRVDFFENLDISSFHKLRDTQYPLILWRDIRSLQMSVLYLMQNSVHSDC